jgi:hypothetical protein
VAPRDPEAAVLVGGALGGRGGLVADEGRPRVDGERLQAGVDDGAVVGRAAHHRRPHERLGAPSRSILRP